MNKRGDTFGFHPDLAKSHLKNGSTLRTFGPILIEALPAVDNLATIRMRPSIPQKINIRFFAPFDKGTFTAIINEGHQTGRSVHPGFSHFTNLQVKPTQFILHNAEPRTEKCRNKSLNRSRIHVRNRALQPPNILKGERFRPQRWALVSQYYKRKLKVKRK